jgi:hypothetical protein
VLEQLLNVCEFVTSVVGLYTGSLGLRSANSLHLPTIKVQYVLSVFSCLGLLSVGYTAHLASISTGLRTKHVGANSDSYICANHLGGVYHCGREATWCEKGVCTNAQLTLRFFARSCGETRRRSARTD